MYTCSIYIYITYIYILHYITYIMFSYTRVLQLDHMRRCQETPSSTTPSRQSQRVGVWIFLGYNLYNHSFGVYHDEIV